MAGSPRHPGHRPGCAGHRATSGPSLVRAPHCRDHSLNQTRPHAGIPQISETASSLKETRHAGHAPAPEPPRDPLTSPKMTSHQHGRAYFTQTEGRSGRLAGDRLTSQALVQVRSQWAGSRQQAQGLGDYRPPKSGGPGDGWSAAPAPCRSGLGRARPAGATST